MSKIAKQFRKQAAKASRFASVSSGEHSEGLSDLAAAFRAQADVLKKSKKKKRKAGEGHYAGLSS